MSFMNYIYIYWENGARVKIQYGITFSFVFWWDTTWWGVAKTGQAFFSLHEKGNRAGGGLGKCILLGTGTMGA